MNRVKASRKWVLAAPVLMLAVAGCAVPAAQHATPHWGYEAEEGPAHWAELSEEYEVCGEGMEQSPVNLDPDAVAREDLADLAFEYRPSAVTVVNNGHTIQVPYAAGSTLTAEGRTYALKQFHFHSPSEHTLHGSTFAAELHLVHAAEDGALAVVGVFLREGNAHAGLDAVLANLPAEAGAERNVEEARVDAGDLLPWARTTYRYDGSLTTPPCSEGVRWYVMTHAVEVSAEQLDAFRALYDGNNRPVQPLHERAIVQDSSIDA